MIKNAPGSVRNNVPVRLSPDLRGSGILTANSKRGEACHPLTGYFTLPIALNLLTHIINTLSKYEVFGEGRVGLLLCPSPPFPAELPPALPPLRLPLRLRPEIGVSH